MKAKEILIIFLLLSTFIFFACTGNPFSDDEISPGNRQISGKVEVSGNQNPEGVYVWLEGFNIGTRTDEQGCFQLTLPMPASQGGSAEGVAGAFNLYYYVANFNLESTRVLTRNGSFVYSQGDINSKGELNNPKFLFQNLQIRTRVTPSSLSSDDFQLWGEHRLL